MTDSFFFILDYSILGFGGLFCIIWSIGLALEAPKKNDPVAVFFVGISGVRLVWEGFTLSGFAYQYPNIYAIPIPFLYLTGPVILLYYEHLAGREKWKLGFPHYIPFLLATLFWIYWYSRANALKILLVPLVQEKILS